MIDVILAALAGLLIGSFLNVCIFRLPRDLSVVRPRSFCPFCERGIAWYDNIPLVSFLILRGRCRYCREPIPWRYPLVELSTGVAFALCVAASGLTLTAAKYAVFSAILIALIATDFEERILPDEFTLSGIVIGLVFAYFVPLDPLLARIFLPSSLSAKWASVAESVIGAGVASGGLWFVGFLYKAVRKREGLGLGDVKMVAMVGAFLGLQPAFLTLFVASLFGAITGIVYICVKGKKAATYELPLGSFLGMAALAVAVFGPLIVGWYGRLGA